MPFSSAMSLLMTLVTVVGIMSEGRGKNLKGPYHFSQGAQKGLIVGKDGQIQGFNLLLCPSLCLLSSGLILNWLAPYFARINPATEENFSFCHCNENPRIKF